MKYNSTQPSLSLCAAATLLLLAASRAHAAFTFTNIADSNTPAPSGAYHSFRDAAVSGTSVAFKARYLLNPFLGDVDGIFSGAGGPLSMAISTLEAGPSIDGFPTNIDDLGPPSIYQNSIVFWGHYANQLRGREGQAVFSSTGRGWRIEIDYRQSHLLTIESPVITNVGTYFLGSTTAFDPDAIYLRGMNRFAGLGDPVSPSGTLTSLGHDLAASGSAAAFRGSVGVQEGVFRTHGNATTAIALAGDPATDGSILTTFEAPAVSGDDVAFRAAYARGVGIFTGSGGAITAIAKTGDAAPGGGAFTSFSDPAISSGAVAFHATLASGEGVFHHHDGAWTTVLKTGDSLFGSSVTSLAMSSRGLDPDGSGTLAIIYGLADGRTGVALATPGAPPPTESANFNGDDFVNAADLAAWTQDFGLPADAAHSQGDADYDLDVDGRDFLVWQRQFFPSPSSTDAAPVPEPAAACLAILAALATLPRIKPRRPR